jgi:putative peptide zinc metalloprotease protein
MRPIEPRSALSAPRHTQPPRLAPDLERTLIASGWTLEELNTPARSPLANLRVADLQATLMAPNTTVIRPARRPPETPAPAAPASAHPPAQPSAHVSGKGARPTVDLNATHPASDLPWLAALAALAAADLHTTLISPALPRRDSAGGMAAPVSPVDLEVTRVAPVDLPSALAAPAVQAAPSQPAQSGPTQPAQPELAALPPVAERPSLAPGVHPLGVMQDSGFAERQWLAQRDETFLQLSELLYRVLEHIDGRRSLAEIATAAAQATGRPVSANNVRLLIAARLLPLGLVAPAEGAATPDATPRTSQPRSPLQVTFRLGFLGPRHIEPFTRVLQTLFWPPLLVPLLAVAAACQVWLFALHGLPSVLRFTAQHPLLIPVIEGLVLLSAVFHEFGHASALRYGGGRARSIGFGFYLMDPAFYTDCTDSYRLNRWGRLRTDLGGAYFDLLTALGLFALYAVTRQEILLAAIVILDWEVLEQFFPHLRFDGYWALADLVGVPDFFALMGPVVRGMLPTRIRAWLGRGTAGAPGGLARAQAPALKGWVKVVFLAYTVVVVPLLVFFGLALLAFAPRFAGLFAGAAAQFAQAGIAAYQSGDVLGAIGAGVEAILLLIAAVLILYLVFNILRSVARGLWRWARPTTRRRALALVVAGGLLIALLLLWTPQVEALVAQLAPLVPHLPSALRLP